MFCEFDNCRKIVANRKSKHCRKIVCEFGAWLALLASLDVHHQEIKRKGEMSAKNS